MKKTRKNSILVTLSLFKLEIVILFYSFVSCFFFLHYNCFSTVVNVYFQFNACCVLCFHVYVNAFTIAWAFFHIYCFIHLLTHIPILVIWIFLCIISLSLSLSLSLIKKFYNFTTIVMKIHQKHTNTSITVNKNKSLFP